MEKGKKMISKQPTSTNQEPKNPPNLWPDLPQPILHQIGRKSSLLLEIYSKPVIKSYRSESSKHNKSIHPWLELSSFQEYSQNKPHTVNITFKTDYYQPPVESPLIDGYHFLGCSYGLLISRGDPDYRLWDPVAPGCWHLPEWDNRIPFVSTALSAMPMIDNKRNSSTLIVLTGTSNPAFAYCRIWDFGNWIKRESNMDDPNDQKGQPLKLCNGIWFEGKFYALSLQGTLAVIEDVGDNDLQVTCLSKKRAVPSIPCAHFKECLVESDGKIWLIFLISKSSIKVLNFLEVYELDIERLTWVKKDDLKNKTLFVGANCCMFTSGDKVKYKGNCVYFSDSNGDGWWLYDMKTGSVSPCSTLSNSDES